MIETPPAIKRKKAPETFKLDDDPLWYKDAIIYELHVRAFSDSDGDGSIALRAATRTSVCIRTWLTEPQQKKVQMCTPK